MHIATLLTLMLSLPGGAAPFDDAAMEHLLRTERRFVLCLWSPHMPLSVEAVHEVMRAAKALGVPVIPLLDPRADRAYARSVATAAQLPEAAMRIAEPTASMPPEVFHHAPTIVVFANGRQAGPVRPGYLDAAGYEHLLRNLFAGADDIVRPTPDEPPIDDVNWFVRPVPHPRGHKVVAFASHNLNYLYDLTTGGRIRIPDRSDAVATPDGRYITVPSHYTADHTVNFYDLPTLLARLDAGRDAADVPPVFAHRSEDVYDVYYQSVGVLSHDAANGSERTTYRMMFSGSHKPAPPGFRIVDYTFTTTNGHVNVQPTAAMRLCPEIVRDLATPFISKDGRFVIAHDDSQAPRPPSLKIFEIVATDPEHQTTTCRRVMDFGFPAGKADFSYDGSRVTFHLATFDYLAAFIDGGLKPPITTDVVVADLVRTDGRITGYANLTRVTQTLVQGTGSYFPAFFPDGSLFYISSAVPKTASAPKRFTFTVTSIPARPQQPPPRSCDGPLYRLLDFWVGSWDVFLPDGKKAGTNRIEKALAGCAIFEHWQDTAGGGGKSLFYAAGLQPVWKQVWVTDSGSIKEKQLIEQLPGGALRFQGTLPRAGGDTVLDRTTLTPQDAGRVRQLIEQSDDNGVTWRTTFLGLYTRSR
jgi:hypothetical protein